MGFETFHLIAELYREKVHYSCRNHPDLTIIFLKLFRAKFFSILNPQDPFGRSMRASNQPYSAFFIKFTGPSSRTLLKTNVAFFSTTGLE
ncbi:MAG: hypothetical protein EBS66_13325 [Betaproteobacteria bacterium]|nr:hypothetical protein [Betaproteobacteria bacterium]